MHQHQGLSKPPTPSAPVLPAARPTASGWGAHVEQFVQAARHRLRLRRMPAPKLTRVNAPQPGRAIVIINPSKFDHGSVGQVQATIADACQRWGWQPPQFVETTAEDPGCGQTQQALHQQPDLVMACGGDGTVRCVAQELAGRDVPLGLLPAGTGNLLARNLGHPLDDLAAAVEVALTGVDRTIDVGWVSLNDQPEQAFLVMTGLGYDAEIMAHAPAKLKARMGPVAYVVSGARRLRGHRVRLELRIEQRLVHNGRVRSVLIGNCGKIQAGISLMPNAAVDDGALDALILSPRSVVGWMGVMVQLITHRRRGHRNVDHYQGQVLSATLAHPKLAQIDGDPVGVASTLSARVQPGALRVRVPAADSLE